MDIKTGSVMLVIANDIDNPIGPCLKRPARPIEARGQDADVSRQEDEIDIQRGRLPAVAPIQFKMEV